MQRTLIATFAAAALALAGAASVHAQDPKPAAEAPAPVPGQEPDPKIVEDLMTCLAEGLTPQWQKAWIVVQQFDRDAAGTTRTFSANVLWATDPKDDKGMPLKTCGAEIVVEGIGKLNAYLPDSQQRWTGAVFTFHRDGRYLATYDYTPLKPKPAAAAKPAAKPAAKKKEAAK
jgi:hypothetical protein